MGKDEWFLINIVENNYIDGQIFEPFVQLLQNEKDCKHFANIFKMARKSQQNMWCCPSKKEKENTNMHNQNGNCNPYLDQTLVENMDDYNGTGKEKNKIMTMTNTTAKCQIK